MNKKESFSQIFESLKKKSGYNDFAESGGISKNNTSSSESLTEKLFIRAQDIAYLRALSSVHYYRTLKSSNKKLSAPIIFIKRRDAKAQSFLFLEIYKDEKRELCALFFFSKMKSLHLCDSAFYYYIKKPISKSTTGP